MKMILLNILLALGFADAQTDTSGSDVFCAGEELQYKVSWNFVRLGTIVVRTLRDTATADSGAYRVRMSVRSNPDLPFIRLREVNESLVNTLDAMTKAYDAKHCSGDDCREIHYRYDDASREARVWEARSDGGLVYSDTLGGSAPFVEGVSLFFLARRESRSVHTIDVPTMVNGKLRNTRLSFSGENETIEVEGAEEEIVCRAFAGYADWQGGGSAGLTGEFTGWITDDTIAVPVRVEMKILLGSIVVELERWKRAGWAPPVKSTFVER